MHKLVLAITCLLLTLATPIHPQSAPTPSPLGIWRGTLDSVPSVTLTLADDTGTLDGTIVFYAVNGGTKRTMSIEPHTLIHPALDGNALTFQVKRLDATLITVKVLFATPTKAQLHCLDCGDDAPIADLTKDTL